MIYLNLPVYGAWGSSLPEKHLKTPVGKPPFDIEEIPRTEVFHGSEVSRIRLLDYLNDLNAMHAAEKSLNDENDHHYSEVLESVVGARLSSNNACDMQRFRSATAAQRAEAFLKTLNLWTNE